MYRGPTLPQLLAGLRGLTPTLASLNFVLNYLWYLRGTYTAPARFLHGTYMVPTLPGTYPVLPSTHTRYQG